MEKRQTIKCSGLDEKSQHPAVYLTLKNGQTRCPYCSKVFEVPDNNKND